MFRVDISNYHVEVVTPDGKQMVPYDVKDSIADILLNPQQKLNGTGLLKASMLAEKVMKASWSVLLEDAEYQMLRTATDTVQGFSRNEVELVRRIMEAERVEVQEVPSAKGGNDDNA